MTLKLSSRSLARRKSDFVFAPDLRYSSMSFCWSLGLGILMCHLSHRGQVARLLSGLFCFIFYLDSLSRLRSDWSPFWGKGLCGTNGNLSYKDTPCQYKEMILLLLILPPDISWPKFRLINLSTSWLVDWVKSVVWSVSQFWHELKLTYWPANLLNKATQKSKDIEGRAEKLVCLSEKLLSFHQKALKLLVKSL